MGKTEDRQIERAGAERQAGAGLRDAPIRNPIDGLDETPEAVLLDPRDWLPGMPALGKDADGADALRQTDGPTEERRVVGGV